MFSSRCVFCGHGNPAGAKYCNDCAAPLKLKLCDECASVNDRSAQSCEKCGADFPIEREIVESIPARVGETASLHYASGWSSAEVSDAAGPLQQNCRKAEAVVSSIEVLHRARPLRGSVTPLWSVAQRMAHVVPVLVHEERARIGVVNRIGLPLLLAAAVTLTVYWAYPLPASISQDARASPQTIRTPAPSASAAASGAAGASITASAAVPSDSVASPVVQGRIRTTGPKDDDKANAAPAALDSAPPDVEATRTSSKPADSSPNVVRISKPQARDPAAAASARHAATGSAKPVPDTYKLLVRASSGETPRDDDRRPCTSDVAALGLCAPRTDVNR